MVSKKTSDWLTSCSGKIVASLFVVIIVSVITCQIRTEIRLAKIETMIKMFHSNTIVDLEKKDKENSDICQIILPSQKPKKQ